MPGKKQKKRTRKTAPVSVDTGFDIGHEIEQGLKALAGKAREGDPQALKLLMAYRERSSTWRQSGTCRTSGRPV